MDANRAAVAANQAYRAGDLDAARQLTDQAAALDPARADLWQQHQEQITARLVNRFTGALVDVIKQPITVAVLEEVIDVLRTGHYARNLARAVDENKQELRQLVVDERHTSRRQQRTARPAPSNATDPAHTSVIPGQPLSGAALPPT